jgi:PRC-barrel domain protein
MLKKLLVTTALSGLMMSSALAQSPSPSSSSPSPSVTTPPSASSSDPMKADTPKAADIAKSASASASTISSQKPDQLLATKVKGADVIGDDDKKIGDISDLLFSKDGKLEAYVISVGGFLGVGAKEVALAPSAVQLSQDKDTWKLKVSASKEQLTQAPNFERYKDVSGTTGAGMGSSSAPRNAPGGSPPANRP